VVAKAMEVRFVSVCVLKIVKNQVCVNLSFSVGSLLTLLFALGGIGDTILTNNNVYG
jgi:hypothetical protein